MSQAALFPRLAELRPIATIKAERWTTVDVLEIGTRRIVRKVYRNRPSLWWRTWLTRSRSAREYQNLDRVRRAGVPCIEALAWDEARRFGCVAESALLTRFVADAPSLKQVLADPRSQPARRKLAEAVGMVLRELHAHGFLGCRITPRNFLVVGAPVEARLMLLDLPAAIAFAGPLLGTRRASIDLFDAAFSNNRKRQFTNVERLRIVVAYCAQERVLARRMWARLCRRATWWNQLQKAVLVSLDSYVLPLIRGQARMEPMREFD